MQLQHKILALDRTLSLKALSDGPGQLVGYASVWNGVDAYGDTIVRGAYADTIPQFIQRGTLHAEHDSRIRLGTITDAKEDDHGLLIVSDFHSDPEAQRYRVQIQERLERGKFVGLSIGYQAEAYEFRDPLPGESPPPFGDKIRVLKRIKLYEASEVTIPADEAAEVIAMKSRPFDVHSDDLRVAVEEWVNRARSGSDLRTKEGRAISTARRERMATVSGSLRSAADEIDAMLEETAPSKAAAPERIHIGLELRRRRLERHGIDLEFAS
jgi:HK97 family phage prohead protease